MKTVFWYLYFWKYMFFTFLKLFKVNYLRKNGTKEELETYVNQVGAQWGRDILKKTGSRIVVIGNENLPEGNCLFVANHQSYFDIPLLLGYINKPMGFIAKKEIEKVPMVSRWMREIQCIFMDRENIRESVKSIGEGIEKLKQGYSMVIFPEGTRSKDGSIGEFKQGSMKLGTKAGVPIVPVTIEGTYNALGANGKEIRAAEIKLIISKPIYTKELSKEEQGKLALTIKESIADNLKKIRAGSL